MSKGRCGWAYVLVANDKQLAEKYGHLDSGSNNDAELEAALQGLADMAKRRGWLTPEARNRLKVVLVSDSQLVLGWATGKFRCKQEAKRDRIELLSSLYKDLGASSRWERGHSGNPHNERADVLAGAARLGGEPKAKRRRGRIVCSCPCTCGARGLPAV